MVALIPDAKKLFHAPASAGSTLEALQQRYDKYKTSEDQAKQEGNGSKARRMGRIVKVIVIDLLTDTACTLHFG